MPPSNSCAKRDIGCISKLLIRLELSADAPGLSDFQFDCYSSGSDSDEHSTVVSPMPQHNNKKSAKPHGVPGSARKKAQPPEPQLQQSSSTSVVCRVDDGRGVRTPSPILVETYTDVQDLIVKASSVEPASAENYDFVGIMHLYKEDKRTVLPTPTNTPSKESSSNTKPDESSTSTCMRSRMLCLLAVPAKITCRELLQFLSPVSKSVSVMRIIRDATANQYMVLVTFINQADADLFYRSFNGAQYNSIEPDLCHLAYVSRIETSRELRTPAIEGHTELPTCPVCLERMDESVDGILTILCNHSFHGSCLSQWGDTSCPVCRYCQTPELTPEHKCMACGIQTDLWICLICGNMGCGRHFRDTSHTFSLQVGTQRVWDYAGDNYVHRLIQSKGDGKVVEFEPSNRHLPTDDDEKLEAVTLEYTYLLTNQLESQREFFEEKLAVAQKMAESQVESIESKFVALHEKLEKQEAQIKQLLSEKAQLEKKMGANQQKVTKLTNELKEEQEMNKFLRTDQDKWHSEVKTLEQKLKASVGEKQKEIDDLREQLRDLLFHFEAQTKLSEAEKGSESAAAIATHDELLDSTVQVGTMPRTPKRANKKKK